VTAIVTAVYAFFTILLWWATRRQAALTRQIFEATHRPELAIRPYLRFETNPGFLRLDFKLTNHGSLTATVTDWKAAIRQGETLLAESAPFAARLCVFPHAEEDALPFEAKGQQARAVWDNNPPVYLRAAVDYRGSNPRGNYSTRLRARLRITGQLEFRLEEVEHEVT
jgi:hypothetical protein